MTKARSLSDFIESDGSVTLVDNQKIKVGTGNDLQIFHASGENFIRGSATASPLYIDVCENLHIRHLDTDGGNAETVIKGIGDGAVELYHDGSKKLETTSTGVDVTGSITSDGLTVDGNATISTAGSTVLNVEATSANDSRVRITAGNTSKSYVEFADPDDADTGEIRYDHNTNSMEFRVNGNQEAITIDSNKNVGIGVSSPNTPAGNKSLHIAGTTGAELILERDDSGVAADDFIGGLAFLNSDASNTPPHYTGIVARASNEFGSGRLDFFGNFEEYPSGTPNMTMDNTGVGIGQSSPGHKLTVNASAFDGVQLQSGGSDCGYLGVNTNTVYVGAGSNLIFHTGNASLTNGTEKLRIEPSQIVLNGGTQTYSNNQRIQAGTESITWSGSTSAQSWTSSNNLPYQKFLEAAIHLGYVGNGAISQHFYVSLMNTFTGLSIQTIHSASGNSGSSYHTISFTSSGAYNTRRLVISNTPASGQSTSNLNGTIYYGIAR